MSRNKRYSKKASIHQTLRAAGQREREILKGLEQCEWFLLVMSSRSAESKWVRDELHWALDNRDEKVIPVLIEECKSSDFHIRLPRIQHVDWRGDLDLAQKKLLSVFGIRLPEP